MSRSRDTHLIFVIIRLMQRSHMFLNLRLTAYMYGNTKLSEYCTSDRSKNTTKQEEKIP